MATGGISAHIQADTKEVERMLAGIKLGAPKVITRALNKTASAVRTKAVRALAKDLAINQHGIKRALTVRKAHYNRLRSAVEASGKRIPLKYLDARPTRAGVSYKGQGGRRQRILHAFQATMPSTGHSGIFARYGKKRVPPHGRYAGTKIKRQAIAELTGPSIPYVMVKEHIQGVMDRAAIESWQKIVDHELKFFLLKGR